MSSWPRNLHLRPKCSHLMYIHHVAYLADVSCATNITNLIQHCLNLYVCRGNNMFWWFVFRASSGEILCVLPPIFRIPKTPTFTEQGTVLNELIVKFFYGDFTPQGFKLKLAARGSARPVANESRGNNFHLYLQTPSGENGTQTCNTCHAAMVQDTIRKHAATSAAARLKPLRERLRHARVLYETWEAIAERRNSHGPSRVQHFQASSATDANKSDCVAQAPPASRQKSPEYVYMCPFCNAEVTSSIASGHIDHRHVCGKQFRVENGSLRPTMRYARTCPTCGTCVHSSREAGRIRSKHKQPNGRACPQTEWQTS